MECSQDDEGTQSFLYKAFFTPCEIYPYFVVAIVQMGNLRSRGLICLGQGKLWLVIRTLVYSGLELLRVRTLVY